jgi:hypothetical protein
MNPRRAVLLPLALLLLALAPPAHAAPAVVAVAPQSCTPLRWDGGPLELVRRERYAQWEQARVAEFERKAAEQTKAAGVFANHDEEAARPKPFAAPPMTDQQKQAVRDWYRPATLDLLQGSPYNCLLLTWSLGGSAESESEQRTIVAEYAGQARNRGLAVFAVIEPGPEWPAAVEAAATIFDGVVLESRFPGEPAGAIPEGEFPEAAARQAFDLLHAKNPDAVVVRMSSWELVERDGQYPIVAAHSGVWPGMLSPSEATGWGAGPTSNPWVLSNGWQIGVLRADGSGRPAWMGHRPSPHRPQPLVFNDYARAVADSGMSGARWIVAVGDDWRPRLAAGEKEALEEWNKLSEYVRFFEGLNQRWKDFQVWPSVVVVHDPSDQSTFDSFDVLNMLAVRQVPHRIILRPDFKAHALGADTRVLAFDYAPPDDSERQNLQSFTQSGGTLVTGPRWYTAQSKDGAQFPRLVAGAGSIRGFSTAQAVDSDHFSRTIRDMVDQEHGAPKLYNVGSIISLYSVNPATGQALLQMTEYGDYPTENVTVRLPNKIHQARLYSIGAESEDLKIYDGEDGGSEFDVAKVPIYCAIVME